MELTDESVHVERLRNNVDDSEFDILWKVVLAGESGVGKSSLVQRYVRREFVRDSRATIGVEFGKIYASIGGKNIKLQIWDTAGQEKFRVVTSLYYRNSHGAVLTYDITDRRSFECVDQWSRELKAHSPPDCVVLLFGNKYDNRHLREVTTEEGRIFADENNFLFCEGSALDSTGVDEGFETLLKDVVELYFPSAAFFRNI